MRRSMLLMTAVLSAVLSACGTETTAGHSPGASPAAPDGEPFVVVDGEVMVSCGGDTAGWPPSVMTGGVQGALTDDEGRRISQDILNDPRTGEEAALSLFPDGVDVDWRVLREDPDSLVIGVGSWTGLGPTGERARILGLERDGEGWRAAGWGDCRLSPVLKEGNSWVEVAGYQREADSSRLTARVNERECTSGRDPQPFLHEPFVVETNADVTVYWTSEPPKGGQNCQGNPSIDRVLQLEQPLGTRPVFDGSSYPPREVTER